MVNVIIRKIKKNLKKKNKKQNIQGILRTPLEISCTSRVSNQTNILQLCVFCACTAHANVNSSTKRDSWDDSILAGTLLNIRKITSDIMKRGFRMKCSWFQGNTTGLCLLILVFYYWYGYF